MGNIQPNPCISLSCTQPTEVKRPLNFGLKYDIDRQNFENKINCD